MFGDARMIDGRIPRCAEYVGAAALVVLLCDCATIKRLPREEGATENAAWAGRSTAWPVSPLV
jgi:hypothetical protein